MSIMVFTPFERQLLKLASKETQAVAKSAKAAAKKAYLTEGESEAHELIGYAEEAVRFLDAPDGPNADEVQLSFGHRTALRTGCLIMIADIESIADEQTDCLVDADGISATRKRAEDYRRLEARLRTMDDAQTSIPFADGTPTAPSTDGAAAAPETAVDTDDGPLVGEGPFDAEGVPARLALPPAQPDLSEDLHADIPDALWEETSDVDANDPTTDAWLNTPLREISEVLDEADDAETASTPYADDAAIDDDPTAAPTV